MTGAKILRSTQQKKRSFRYNKLVNGKAHKQKTVTESMILRKVAIWNEINLDSSLTLSSVWFGRSVVSDSLRPHGLQHARLPCPSPTPGAYSNSCPLSRRCLTLDIKITRYQNISH